jgi:hypothetical protein
MVGMSLRKSVSRVILTTVLLLACEARSDAGGYTNGVPSEPGFFPVGVWLQSPARAPNYKAIGINTFVGMSDGPREEQLSELARYDMFAVSQQNDVGLKSANRNVIKAWLHQDEPDNAQPIGLGLFGSCIPPREVVRQTHEMKARDPTRPVMINFGQGVANEFWKGRGPCTGDQTYYDIAIQGADILSFDIYPVGSKIPQVRGKLEYVARGVTNLVQKAIGTQSVWAVLETTALNPPHRVMPAQVRAEVWMALIHGASGVVYFVHEFSPTFREDAIFRYPDVTQEVAKTNQLIKTLSPILKSPNVSGKALVTSTTPITTMVKLQHNTVYLFAVGMKNSASRARFTIAGVDKATALVLGEERTVTITNGVFEDWFEGYGVHLYQIPLN